MLNVDKMFLKAFEIPTGLLICWPFTSIKEKLVGFGLVGATCLSIFHSFFELFMFSMISFLIYAALAFAIFLTTLVE